ncbi:MAG: hypothetical protein AB7F91_13080 [Parvularculaceae bacterium]
MRRFLLTAMMVMAAGCGGGSPASDVEGAELAAASGAGFAVEERGADSAPYAGQPAIAQSPIGQPVMAQAGGSPGRPAGAVPAGVAHLQRYDVMDSNGFEKPMPALSVLAPVGWRTVGGVNWAQNLAGCGPTAPHFNWTAAAPDGVGQVAILPQESWTGFNASSLPPMPQQNQCPNFRPTNGRDFVIAYVQRYRPNARVLDYQDKTADYADAQRQLQQLMPPMQGTEQRLWIEAGLALIAYPVNGREVREIAGTAVMFNATRMPDMMGGFFDSYFAYAMPGFAYRAESGKLDFNLAETIRKSARENPEWSKRMAEFNRKIAKINSDGARERAEINRRSNAEISAIRQETWDNQQRSNDRMNREFGEYVKGVETYDDPYNGGTVQLDNTYDKAYQLNDGTFVLSNDPSFEPYAVFGQDGVELKKTE